MTGNVKMFGLINVWLTKGFDLSHGYGYHVHATDHDNFFTSYHFSKNKFKAVRGAIEDVKRYNILRKVHLGNL